MLFKIAWRNIWRNKRRSLIVISSVITGAAAMVFLDGLNNGMLQQMLFNEVNSDVSHIQIHKKGFMDNKNAKGFMPSSKTAEDVVKNNPNVKNYSKRVISFGLISSASASSGTYIEGIDAADEQKITSIKNSIIEGTYFESGPRGAVIGRILADKLGVSIGDKVVVMLNTPEGSVGSDVFRISGVYETYSSAFDRTHIYIPIEHAQEMMDIGDSIFEIALVINDYNDVEKVKQEISSQLSGDYEVLSYRDIMPLLIMMLDFYKEMMVIVNFILSLALIFGIVNVMLMAVFERIKEFGVLLSLGMKTLHLFKMIVVEALIIGIMGSVLGIVLGLLITVPLTHAGIDLSMFSEGLKQWGVGAVIYPIATIENIISLVLTIPLISAIGAVYPAYKAIKLQPVHAMRYI